ncbi:MULTISPECIES: cell division protein FtsQ/DivIB [Roseobacteraceae]|jgi:cell division protein FtsQ|uniref:Cell division protein FtsQ n=1 Tax=Pseudosulfitobacter pseudonitzschiae TaxID=1402135 RepID=A0A221K1E9_9RHOB|nr:MULTISPECIES: cell division protein FtsQ/DivIB [Roseobacteraceae]ASM72743.1 cell division protein FtsQ [Pseudosulfitobacter pseudonitzschiae]
MQSLIRRNKTPKADPAPSRWAWRLQRLMLTPGFRFGLRFGVPFTLAVAAGAIYLSDDARRQSILDTVAEARRAIEERPEFMVQVMAIDGASTETAEDIREILPLDFPASSFDLDLEHIRHTVTELDPVKEASVRIRPGGILHIEVTPRIPVAVWRQSDGLTLIDETGAHVAGIARRDLRPDLPLVAGEGADKAVTEALSLIEAASPLGNRLRGVVRVGLRRWDLVLDRDQRVLLPEYGAVRALERVIALENAQDVLSRDVARVDMRLAQRPTLKMNEAATQELWRIRQIEMDRQ